MCGVDGRAEMFITLVVPERNKHKVEDVLSSHFEETETSVRSCYGKKALFGPRQLKKKPLFRSSCACAKYHSGLLSPYILYYPMILLVDKGGPDQTAWMRRLIWAFAVPICLKTHFRMGRPICLTTDIFLIFPQNHILLEIITIALLRQYLQVCITWRKKNVQPYLKL